VDRLELKFCPVQFVIAVLLFLNDRVFNHMRVYIRSDGDDMSIANQHESHSSYSIARLVCDRANESVNDD
jgi:hypothetical protein